MSMEVRRIHTARGSHIEPELNPLWSTEKQIEWHAAVVSNDTGAPITVLEKRRTFSREYQISHGTTTALLSSFGDAWSYLNGFDNGFRAGKKEGTK